MGDRKDRKPTLFKAFTKQSHSEKHTSPAHQDASFSDVEIDVADLKTVLHEKKTTPTSESHTERTYASDAQSDIPAPSTPTFTSSAKTIAKEDIMREILERARAEMHSSYATYAPAEMTKVETVVEQAPVEEQTPAEPTAAPAKFHETLDKITAQETPLKETVYTPEAEIGTITIATAQTETVIEIAPAETETEAVQEDAQPEPETPTETETTPTTDAGERIYRTGFAQAARSFIAYAKKESNRKAAIVFASVIFALILVGTFTANFSFAFAARVNGQYVGIVGNKLQCETIVSEINNVLELNFGESEKINHDISISPRIILKDHYTPDSELRSAIYSLSDKMLEMHVIYAGETSVCALGSADAANNVLAEFELFYTGGDANVQFSTSAPLTVKQELAPVTLLCEVGEALNILNGAQNKEEGEYVVRSGDTLWSIARKYDTTVDDIISLNPNAEEEIRIGDKLRVMAYAPVVTVTTVKRVEYDETIDYTTEVVETKEMYRGKSEIAQAGEDGERHIVADLVKVNGLEVRRDIIEETVTKEPVTQIKKVGIAEPPKGYGTGSFRAPCTGTISSYFGTRRSGYHKGIDIANSYGTPIRASDNGRVIFAGWDNTGFGRLVKLDHQNGYISYYGHNSRIAVSVGQAVNKGDIIAYMGSTGNSTGNHCHFELYYNGRLLNPYSYIY